MKMKSAIALVIALVMLGAMPSAAQTYNQTASIYETENAVNYWGTITMATDSTGDWYTQALMIQDCNYRDAYVTAWTDTAAATDVNFLVEYSFDRVTWKDMPIGSGKLFDDLNAGTIQSDTLNVIAGVKDHLYATAVWVRFHADGQTGNPDGTIVFWSAHFIKEEPKKLGSNRAKNKI